MKKLILTFVSLALGFGSFPQEVSKQKLVPKAINYQGFLYNPDGSILSDTTIGFRMTIKSGAPDGEMVFCETHIATTSTNGTVSLAIGAGMPLFSSFDSINWSSGSFFLEVAIDLMGGGGIRQYQVMGVTQFLSVPYAFHAATADSLTGTIIENDPIFLGSVSAGITAPDTTFWNQKQDQISVGPGLQKNINLISLATYEVGDWAHGGIVFWVDNTGQHGLVCEKGYLHNIMDTWIPAYAEVTTNARGDGPMAGEMNTAIIIAVHSATHPSDDAYAARLCADLVAVEDDKSYGDWYLPSIIELELMHANREIINMTALAHGGHEFMTCQQCWYWSSTESNESTAWVIHFALQQPPIPLSKNNAGAIRAVRAF